MKIQVPAAKCASSEMVAPKETCVNFSMLIKNQEKNQAMKIMMTIASILS